METESFKTILTHCDVNAKPDDPNEDPLLTKVRDLGLSWPNIEEQSKQKVINMYESYNQTETTEYKNLINSNCEKINIQTISPICLKAKWTTKE